MIDPPRALIVSPREASPRKVRALRNVDIRARGKSEHWLQELVFRHPELLPISEISGEFSPAVPLGMEVEQIDALFVSPRGYLTIVETKLVDNPEARRAVMAQVIDYARKLSTWSTEDLAARVFAARPSVENDPGYPAPIGSSTTQLFQYVRDHAVSVMAGSSEDGPAVPPLIEEAEFLTALQRNMEHARFLLLVVGERDLARLQELVDALQHSFAFLQFTFAIVELTVYEVSDIAEEWLVVPRILLRTKEIRRSVARLEFEGSAKVSFTTPSGTAALRQAADERRPSPVSDDDFLDQLANTSQSATVPMVRQLIDFLRSEQHLALRPTSRGLSVRMPDPRNSSQLMTLFWLDLKGINFYYLRLHLARFGLPPDEIADPFYASVNSAFGGGVHPAVPGAKEQAAPYPNIVPFTKLERGLPEFREAISRLVSAVEAASVTPDTGTAAPDTSIE